MPLVNELVKLATEAVCTTGGRERGRVKVGSAPLGFTLGSEELKELLSSGTVFNVARSRPCC